MKKIVNKNNVRNLDQMKRMQKAEKENLCPFCTKGLKDIHKLPIIKKTKNFFITKTAFPYEGTKYHFLIISKKHITNVNEIKRMDWVEIWDLLYFIIKNKKIKGGSIFWRFGDMQKNGASIAHFHLQVLSGNSSEKEKEDLRESIKVKLGYKKK